MYDKVQTYTSTMDASFGLIVLATEFEHQPVQLQKCLSTSFEPAKRSFQGAFVSARSPALLVQKCRLLGTA